MIDMTLLATVFDLDGALVDAATRVLSECVDGMADAIARGTFGLRPGAADLVALAGELGAVGLVSEAPRRYVRPPRRPASCGTCRSS